MRTILRAATRLYPRAWRARYGEEFNALLDDLTPRWRDVFNIVCGALIMHISRLAALPVVLAIGGVILGAAVSMLMPPVYASSLRVVVELLKGTGDEGERVQPLHAAVEAVLKESAVDENIIAVGLHPIGRGTAVLDLSASAGSPSAAKHATETALGAIIEANGVASKRLAQSAGVQFRVLEVPTLPTTSHRDSTRNSAIGGGLGLGLGGLVVLVARRRRKAA